MQNYEIESLLRGSRPLKAFTVASRNTLEHLLMSDSIG